MEDNRIHRMATRLVAALSLVLMGGCASTSTVSTDNVAPEELVSQARAAKANGEFDASIYLYATALEATPDDAGLLLELGHTYEQTGRYAAAERAYLRTIELEPLKVDAFEQNGLLQLRVGNHDSARAHLFKAIGIDDARWRAHNGLGVLFDLDHDYAKAEVHYTRALDLQPMAAQVWNNRGYSRYLAGRYSAAEGDFLTAIQLGAGNKTKKNLAIARAKRGDYTGALKALAGFDQAESNNEIGLMALENGDLLVAEAFFRTAVDSRASYFAEAAENLKRVKGLKRGRAAASSDLTRKTVRVLAERLSVRAFGDSAAPRVGVLENGQQAALLQLDRNWAQVEYRNSNGDTVSGWVDSAYLETESG